MSHEIGWIIFGKLPTILILCTALYVCARRVGPLLAAWSFAAFFVTLSIGALDLAMSLTATSFEVELA